MARSLKPPDASRKLVVHAKPPGEPLVRAIEAADLMLATRRATPFTQPGWLYELKYE